MNKKSIFSAFESIKGASFVSIKGYENKQGEISNQQINVGVDVMKAKEADLNTLKSLTNLDLNDIAIASNIDVETVKIALSELIASAEKNISKDKADRTAQSQAQTDAYMHVCTGLKLNKESLNVHVSGFLMNKEVIQAGEYKKVNSSAKTLAKKAIQKHADLRMNKYRSFFFSEAQAMKLKGQTFDLSK